MLSRQKKQIIRKVANFSDVSFRLYKALFIEHKTYAGWLGRSILRQVLPLSHSYYGTAPKMADSREKIGAINEAIEEFIMNPSHSSYIHISDLAINSSNLSFRRTYARFSVAIKQKYKNKKIYSLVNQDGIGRLKDKSEAARIPTGTALVPPRYNFDKASPFAIYRAIKKDYGGSFFDMIGRKRILRILYFLLVGKDKEKKDKAMIQLTYCYYRYTFEFKRLRNRELGLMNHGGNIPPTLSKQTKKLKEEKTPFERA